MKRIEKLLVLLGLLGLFGIAACRVVSWDIFWQMHSGRHILETGSFIYRDIFSLADQAPRWEHCWLHDIIFYGAYKALGYDGVSLLKGMLVATTGLTLIAAARVRGACLSAILLVSPAAFSFTWMSWRDRPQLWSFLFFSLFILLLERHRRIGDKGVWLLVPLVVLWANLHGGVLLAFPVLAAYLVGEGGVALRKGRGLPAGYRRLCLVVLAVALAALINPYGWRIYEKLLSSAELGKVAVEQVFNSDWRSTPFLQNRALQYAAGVSALLLAAAWRRIAWTDLLLLGGLFYMGSQLDRHITFLFLAMAALLPAYADFLMKELLSRTRKWRPKLLVRIVVAAAALGLLIGIVRPAYLANGFFDTGLREWQFPVASAKFLLQERPPGNLFNSYDIGGYLMWELYPHYKVFWDGRGDSPEMFENGRKLMYGQTWQGILDRFDINTVILGVLSDSTGKRWPLVDLLAASRDWAVVFHDEWSVVFVRRSAVDDGWLQRHEQHPEAVDETVLAAARNLLEFYPWYSEAHLETVRVLMRRQEYREAFAGLENYLTSTHHERWSPEAIAYYKVLYQMVKK